LRSITFQDSRGIWGIVLNEKTAKIFTSNVRKKNRLAASLAKRNIPWMR
jgi:hypothetical protein